MTTQHARARSQQRGIPPVLIDLLLKFGATQRAPGSVDKVYFDIAARRRVRTYVGNVFKQIDEFLDVYAVMSPDGQVITVAHLTDRIRRH